MVGSARFQWYLAWEAAGSSPRRSGAPAARGVPPLAWQHRVAALSAASWRRPLAGGFEAGVRP